MNKTVNLIACGGYLIADCGNYEREFESFNDFVTWAALEGVKLKNHDSFVNVPDWLKAK